jgi:hypothetical protein
MTEMARTFQSALNVGGFATQLSMARAGRITLPKPSFALDEELVVL